MLDDPPTDPSTDSSANPSPDPPVGPPVDLPTGLMLGILSQLFQSRMATLLQRSELTYTQMSMLSHLERTGDPSTVGELAVALEINQPGVTKVVQRLHESGLVAVEGHPDDRRQKLVSIAAAGRGRLASAWQQVGDDAVHWFDGWSPQEIAVFRDQLQRLVGWFDAHRL